MATVTGPSKPIRLAVLLSGSGRTLQNLADCIGAGSLPVEIGLVIGSGEQAYGLVRARRIGVPSEVVRRRDFGDIEGYSDRVFSLINRAGVDLVCLAGFLSLLRVPNEYAQRVINIHPALLPSFGGQGMYGRHVHEAVLRAGCKVSGCTVHFCDQAYDTGPILVQQTCPVLEEDTPQTLAERVFAQECLAYPEAIRLIAESRVRIEGGRTHILPMRVSEKAQQAQQAQ